MNCTPHNYSSNQIKVEMGRVSGMHVEDKHIQGFDIKKELKRRLYQHGRRWNDTVTGLKERGWERED
jgi:hypothetical protein